MSQVQDRSALSPLAGKRVLVTGGQGMLGRAFYEVLESLVPTAEVLALGKDKLDVRDKDRVLGHEQFAPDFIIHCAAIVNADYCEEHSEEASDVIVDGTRNVAELAVRTGARVVYPQSFLIYDGKELPITETTAPNPLSEYGRLKLRAEQLLCDTLTEALIVRMAGFFGGREIDKNFVGKFVPHIAKLIKAGTRSIEVGDRVWQPTFTDDLAYNALLLAANKKTGTYCMASNGQASFFEMACMITKLLRIDDRFTIVPVSAEKVSANEKAARPDKAIIENRRLMKEGMDSQRPWHEGLAEYLDHPYFRKMFR